MEGMGANVGCVVFVAALLGYVAGLLTRTRPANSEAAQNAMRTAAWNATLRENKNIERD